MRVITGTARGRKLKTLDSLDVRPTPDAVKEAIFSAIQFDLHGANVLDLFAGSGQLGIEALSRGAEHCVFVDRNPEAISVVKENLNACKLTGLSRVLGMDSFEYLQVAKPVLDIVLMDPPYRNGLLEKALPMLSKVTKPGAIIVCEHESELVLGDSYGDLQLYKRYRYGKVAVTIYRKPSDDTELA